MHDASSLFLTDETCVHLPVFTTSRVVVKYGDPANATCVACQNNCRNVSHAGLEVPIGNHSIEGAVLRWNADTVTEWDLLFKCYYVDKDDVQCSNTLQVTVYRKLNNCLCCLIYIIYHLLYNLHLSPLSIPQSLLQVCPSALEIKPSQRWNVSSTLCSALYRV